MAGRRGSRGLNPETALAISIDGTARRLADDHIPTLDAIAQLRDLAGDRVDLLAKSAGGMIGGYLSTPLANPIQLAAAHLLVLASNGDHHDLLTAAADESRDNGTRSAYKL